MSSSTSLKVMQRKKNKDSDYDSPQVIEVDQFGREIRPDTRASGFSTRSSMRDSPIRSINGTRGVQKSPIPTNRGNMRSYDDFETSLRRETSSFDKRKAPPPPASSYIDNPDREEDFYRRSYPESSKHRYEDDDLRPSQQQRTSASMNSSRLYDEPYQSSRPPPFCDHNLEYYYYHSKVYQYLSVFDLKLLEVENSDRVHHIIYYYSC